MLLVLCNINISYCNKWDRVKKMIVRSLKNFKIINFITSSIFVIILTGYQRQLRYRHGDGSFSSFGSRDYSGSTWLTAFVLKSLNQAKPYIYIDNDLLEKAAKFLHLQQNEVTGCYKSQGRVIHKALEVTFL